MICHLCRRPDEEVSKQAVWQRRQLAKHRCAQCGVKVPQVRLCSICKHKSALGKLMTRKAATP
jgi:hypothetical protein